MTSRTSQRQHWRHSPPSTPPLTGCTAGGAGGSGAKGDELEGLTGEIGSKDFSEQYILAYMTAELLNAHGADVEANTKLVGSANVRQALENDQFPGLLGVHRARRGSPTTATRRRCREPRRSSRP